MGKSATLLGKELGLTGQEMNQLLKREGFLEGEPGAYLLTPKGEEFAEQHDFHRGPGGYSWYNRDWTTTTWDESVHDNMNLSTKNLQAAIDAAAEARKAAAAARVSAMESPDDEEATDISENNSNDTLVGIAIAAGAVVIITGTVYAIKKATPHVKYWWNTKAKPWLDDIFR